MLRRNISLFVCVCVCKKVPTGVDGEGGLEECWTPIAPLLFEMSATVGKISSM